MADCPAWVFARSILLMSEVLSSDLLLSTERLLYSRCVVVVVVTLV